MDLPPLCHQSSLMSVIDLAPSSLSNDDRIQAVAIFTDIIEYCKNHEMQNPLIPARPYQRGKLLQLIYDHVLNEPGRDNILRYFLSVMATIPQESSQDFSSILSSLVDFKDRNTSEKNKIVQRVQELADHIVDGFFLPCIFASLNTIDI